MSKKAKSKGGHIPLPILEKRLASLANVVAKRRLSEGGGRTKKSKKK